jgi:hypothetical protein
MGWGKGAGRGKQKAPTHCNNKNNYLSNRIFEKLIPVGHAMAVRVQIPKFDRVAIALIATASRMACPEMTEAAPGI